MEYTYCKLKDVLSSIYSGGTPSTSKKEYWNGPYKWLSSGETGQRFITDTINTITELGIKESSTRLAKRDSVVMACAGQGKTRGQTSYLLDDMYVNQSVIVLKPKESKVLPLYLFYDLSGRYEELRGGSDASSTRGSITTASLKTLPFRYPSIEKQRAIASILSAYDNLIEVNNKRIKVLEQMAENLYKEWFVRFRFPGHETVEFENGIPKGWEYCKLFDIAKVTYGFPFNSESFCDDKSLRPVVRIRDIPNNKTGIYTSEECEQKYKINENAILVGMDGIFHTCLWSGGEAFLNQRVVQISSKQKEISNYYLYLALVPQIKFWEHAIAGTTVAHLGDRHLKRMLVLIPNGDILKKATIVFNDLLVEKNTLSKRNEILVKQRDYLLPRLMSGKLEV